MSAIRDKSMLFYSIHPKDNYSRDFLAELDKNPLLKKQFIMICINDPNIKIPSQIIQLGTIPVLIAPGFSKPILGEHAVSWLTNGGFQDKANGLDFGALGDMDSHKYAHLGDEMKPNDSAQHFNSEYNQGFKDKDTVLNQQFAKLGENSHITTYDDQNEMKKDISGQLEQRLSQYRQQRDADVPRAVKRIGGLEDLQSGNGGGSRGLPGNFNNSSGGSNGGSMAYNPNPFGNHAMPSAGPPQLPFTMPAIGGQAQMMGGQTPMNYNGGYPAMNPTAAINPMTGRPMPMFPNQGPAPNLPFQMPQIGGYGNRNPNL